MALRADEGRIKKYSSPRGDGNSLSSFNTFLVTLRNIAPREGTETISFSSNLFTILLRNIAPREGTETFPLSNSCSIFSILRNIAPREGTETYQ